MASPRYPSWSAAYIGEIFRSGIQSVDKGQLEASRALGFGYGPSMRLVVVPQGIRRVLPALVNQFIALIKESSLVFMLGLLASEREIFQIGKDAAATQRKPVAVRGRGGLLPGLTIPLTHLVNYIDSRLRTGRPEKTEPDEAAAVVGKGAQRMSEFASGTLTGKNIHLSFGKNHVLRGIDLHVEKGTTASVIGPSGSGKSTLLRVMNRLIEPDQGDILLDGRSVLKDNPDELRQRIGMVFQQFNLFPHKTVLDNVIAGAAQAPRPVQGRRPGTRRWRSWTWWAWSTRPMPGRPTFPAASSSGWRSPGRWP